MEKKPRKVRADCTVATFEKKHGITGGLRHANGRDVRGDMKIGNLRKELDKNK
ncbi:MAG: hypothetical protein IJ035_05435 [Oscillospiraceae bacterium]|nr:hypothetical protein [Oscillospiraceae bacterium]